MVSDEEQMAVARADGESRCACGPRVVTEGDYLRPPCQEDDHVGKFAGIWPALVTPLTAEGQVNVGVAETLIEDLLAAGVGGLYVCGGTGEGVLLSPQVRRRMAEVAIGAVAGRVPVMVHVGAIDRSTTLELAQQASSAGADAISAVPPFYFTYPFGAILDHYRAIASVSSVPLYVYHIPGATGTLLTVDQLLQICALDGVAGLKYSSVDLYFLSELLARRDSNQVNVLSGPDQLFLPCLSLGVEGAIGTFYNLLPRLFIDIMESFHRGEFAAARRLQFAANEVIAATRPYGVIPAIKAMLAMQGYDVGQGVPPMPPVEGDQAKRLQGDLERAGLRGLLRRNAIYGPPGDSMRGRLG